MPVQDVNWRVNSVRLAHEQKLVGQAFYPQYDSKVVIRVVCANNEHDHDVLVDAFSDDVWCDCAAGIHGWPCAHAGAALLLMAVPQLAPERPRDELGNRRG